uniref:Putative glycoprotein 6-alpha-l-fucosyltransferase n=1 Tax=Amblyomma cajennense TaxID=34607 RepID=A0A023FEE9_AMBCJ
MTAKALRAMGLGKLIACVLVMWLLVVLMISGPLFHSSEPDEQVLARLTRAVGELESLKQQNEELRSLLNAIKEPSKKEEPSSARQQQHAAGCEPSEEYEVRRRRAANGVQELWFYARAQLKKLLPNLKKEDQANLQRIIDDLAVHRRTILLDLEEMRRADGYDSWRQTESRALTELVRSRLSKLQHPPTAARRPSWCAASTRGAATAARCTTPPTASSLPMPPSAHWCSTPRAGATPPPAGRQSSSPSATAARKSATSVGFRGRPT